MSKATAVFLLVLALSLNLHADCLLRGVQYLETSSEGSDMAIADFNGDGAPDMAVVGTDAGVLRIFLNQGDGSYAIAGEKHMKPAPVRVVAGDFTGDSIPDLAVATAGSIVILANNGAASFKPVQYVRVHGTVAMTAIDIDSDSVADLAALRRNGTESVVTVFRNRGGSLETSQTLAVKSGTDLVAARLGSGPGVDLVASSDRGTITVFKNAGGTFQAMPSTQAVAGAAHIVAGFINGDARTDLVVAGSSGDAAVLLGQNESEFHRILLATGSEIQGLALADFNDDGRSDLLLINRNSRISLYSGNGQGAFKFARGFAYGYFTGPVLAADLNRDGRSDFVAAERGSDGVYLRNGKNTFATGARVILNQGGNLFAGDFDGDGNADLLVSSSAGTLMMRGKGDGSFYPALPTDLPQLGYGSVVDLNGDGISDLAGFDQLKLKAWLTVEPVRFKETSSMPLYVDPPVQSLDVNGDGKIDLALVTGNSLLIFPGAGDGQFERAAPINIGQPFSGTLVDLNGDGILDVATVQPGNSVKQVITYLGGPNLTYTKQAQTPVEGCPGKISAGDANGDGKPDLVVGSTCGEKLLLLFGDGTGGFASSVRIPAGSGSVDPHFVDFNGDGKAEVLAVAQNIGKPSITLAPAFTDDRLLGPFNWEHAAVADFDHDGNPDLAASSYNSTAVFLNCR